MYSKLLAGITRAMAREVGIDYDISITGVFCPREHCHVEQNTLTRCMNRLLSMFAFSSISPMVLLFAPYTLFMMTADLPKRHGEAAPSMLSF